MPLNMDEIYRIYGITPQEMKATEPMAQAMRQARQEREDFAADLLERYRQIAERLSAESGVPITTNIEIRGTSH